MKPRSQRRFDVLTALKKDARMSLPELARACGLSKTAVVHHLHVLRSEGLIDWKDGKHRSIQLVEGRNAE